MPKEQSFEAVIARMSGLETAVSELYREYGSRFTGQQEFWNGLSEEEEQHALFLESIEDFVTTGTASAAHFRFDTNAIVATTARIRGEIDRVRTHELSAADALSVALELERGMTEDGFYRVIAGLSEGTQRVLALLGDETREHIKRIYDAFVAESAPTA